MGWWRCFVPELLINLLSPLWTRPGFHVAQIAASPAAPPSGRSPPPGSASQCQCSPLVPPPAPPLVRSPPLGLSSQQHPQASYIVLCWRCITLHNSTRPCYVSHKNKLHLCKPWLISHHFVLQNTEAWSKSCKAQQTEWTPSRLSWLGRISLSASFR